MSGHSKWHSIRHKKGATDAKRGKLFTKIIKEISVAARISGGDANTNARLRAALLRARAANMPKDNIDRAIKKGTGDAAGTEYHEMTYEAYGPGGVALLIEVLTDNKNRTAAEVRNILSKGGGNLGETGCVSYMFKRKGVIAVDAVKYKEDDVFQVALEAGAEDMTNDGEVMEIITDAEDLESLMKAVEERGIEHEHAEISKITDATITLETDATRKVLKLLDNLEDNDDVQNVSTNLVIPAGFVLDDEA
jgi:YebC/PmpR family DNA-binding regulatory protein